MPREASPPEASRFHFPEELDEKWALVERVCGSAGLRRSAKLRDLLIYLCHRCWVEGDIEIREHEIGVDVFQRPANYDSAQDTLVRVQASQLRKRLEKYFSEEGREEPQILEIAKGSYEPSIRGRALATAAGIPEPGMAVVAPLRWPVYALSVLCVILAGLCIWLALRSTSPRVEGAALRRFWSAFAPEGQDVTVVIADGAFSAIQDVLHRPISLDEYVARGYRAEVDKPEYSADKKDFLRYLMERRYTSLADVMLMRRLWTAGVIDRARTSILFSRDLHLRSFLKGNHILVGSRRAVPWVDLVEGSLDFHFVYDEKSRHIHVENRRPRQGEPKSYTIDDQHSGTGERFSLVASVPNASKTGNLLILSGQEMSGTEAAANLVTTDAMLQEVLSRLPASNSTGVPHFEALLKVKHVEYTSHGYEIIAVHAH